MIDGELIIDSFAGGGGASTGIEMALGFSPDIAINHDPEALAMHAVNHPNTEHHCEDVWRVNPRKVCRGRRVGLFWLSPDCTYHSKARGGKPFRDRNEARGRRGLPWLAVYWAEQVRPRIIAMENVEELAEWGPLLKDGSRDLRRAGFTFRRFVKRLQNLGYEVDWRVLHADDYGVPTIRKRLVLIARCDGEPIVWPEPTRGPGLLPYAACGDELDYSLPCPSIFAPGRNLCENTLRRIHRGFFRYVVNDRNPFIVTTRGTSLAHIKSSARSVSEPLRTITAGRGDHHYLVTAFLARHYGGNENDGWSLHRPLPTITTKDHHALVYAYLIKYYGTDQNPRLDEPLHTITTKDRFALITVHAGPHEGTWRVDDICSRHLVPRELYNCQGFPRNYIIDPSIDGKRLPKHAQTRMCGNSVPPGLVAPVITANWYTDAAREPRRVYA